MFLLLLMAGWVSADNSNVNLPSWRNDFLCSRLALNSVQMKVDTTTSDNCYNWINTNECTLGWTDGTSQAVECPNYWVCEEVKSYFSNAWGCGWGTVFYYIIDHNWPALKLVDAISRKRFYSMQYDPLNTNSLTRCWCDPCTNKGFFTYPAFLRAALAFPQFASSNSVAENRREVAAFFAQASQETTGASTGKYNGGLCWIKEGDDKDLAEKDRALLCTPSTQDPCAPGQYYYGRGPLQLSHNYNYGPAGRFLGLDLLNQPNLLGTNATASFAASLWFWMTPRTGNIPSCHDAIRTSFGKVTNIINGGILRCGDKLTTRHPAEIVKIGYYTTYLAAIGATSVGPNDCSSYTPSVG